MTALPERAVEIFQGALDLEGPSRERYLDECCGDDTDLRHEVERLLALDAEDDPRLAESRLAERRAGLAQLIDGETVERGSLQPSDPEQIGEYTIVRRIGQGAMGIVFEATQEQPRRSIALKVLRRSATTEAHLARFKHETEVLGLLKHPGIAQIYGAGSFDPGDGAQPYFAMELIDGESLLEWADETKASIEARLELFIELCEAVQHAHTKGIIHRDLKPDNVLVTSDGHAKILDFGVARATGSDLLLTTMHTHTGQLVGTVAYMSPEQASGDADQLDARSDIYTLGVMLFELLSGRLPHQVGGRSIPDALHTILQDEPTRLGSVDTAFRGDLDTIAAHALEKEPNRRYASAKDLADDLRRHLAHEPIHARQPSTAYFALKFARRHKGLATGLAIAILSLMVGLVTSLRFALGEAKLRRVSEEQRATSDRLAYRMTMASVGFTLDRGRIAESRDLLASIPVEQRGWEWHHFHAKLDVQLWNTRVLDADVEHGWLRLEGSVCFAAQGERVVAALTPSSLGVWDTASGTLVRDVEIDGTLEPHLIHTVASKVAMVVDRTSLVVCDLNEEQGHERYELAHPISAIAWHPGGDRIAVALDASGERPASALWIGPPGDVRPLATLGHVTLGLHWISGGDELLVVDDRLPEEATVNLTVTGLDPETGATRATYADSNPGHQVRSYTLSLGAAAEGQVALTGTAHQFIHIHRLGQIDPDATVQAPHGRLGGHVTPQVHDIGITPDGRRAASVSADGSVRVWDLDAEIELASFLVEGRPRCAIDPNGRFLAINGGGRLFLWDLESEHPRVLRGHRTYVYYSEFAPDGQTLLSVGFDQDFRLWDPSTGMPLGSIEPGSAARPTPWQIVKNQQTWSADGKSLIVAGLDQAHRAEIGLDRAFRPAGAGSPMSTDVPTSSWIELCGGPRSTPRFEFAPNGKLVLDVQRGELVEIATGEVLRSFEGIPKRSVEPESAGFSASFSPDGSRVAITRLSEAFVHDVATGKRIASISTKGGGMHYGVAWSPDGTRLAIGSSDGNVRLWDAVWFEPIVTLEGHGQYVHDVNWSPDGSQLASASGDGTVRLWDSLSTVDRLTRTHAR